MPFTRTNWMNYSPPAINAANLLNMEDGIWYGLAHSGGVRNTAEFLDRYPASTTGGLDEAIADLGGSPGVVFAAPHNHPINVNTAIPATVHFIAGRGATFTIANGITLTINGPPQIGLYRVFICIGTGRVIFGGGSIQEVYPEWWGAKADGLVASAVLNSTSINAALVASRLVRLAKGIYYVQTSVIVPNWTYLRGSGKQNTIIKANAAIAVIQSKAVGTPAYEDGVRVSDLTIDGNNIATEGLEVGDAANLCVSPKLSNLLIVNCINGIIANSFIWGSMDDILILGVNDAGVCYGLQFKGLTQSCVPKNVVVTGFKHNWHLKEANGIHAIRCVSYAEAAHGNNVNLMLIENSYSNVFEQMQFEYLATGAVDEVRLIDLAASAHRTSANTFKDCWWNGTGANSTRVVLGDTAGGHNPVYMTTFQHCRTRINSYGYDLHLVNSRHTHLYKCLRSVGYSGRDPYSWLILGSPSVDHGQIIPVRNRLAAPPTAYTSRRGEIVWEKDPTAGATPGWICVQKGTTSAATDNTGDTDGATAVITGMTDTSDFYIGQFVKVSAGFPSAVLPYQILGKTATSLTLDTNSNAAVANVTVTTCVPIFKAMANLAA